MPLSKELLDILACPKCKGDIVLNRAGNGLICKACRLVYEIKDDIPVMLIDEALPYKGEEGPDPGCRVADNKMDSMSRGPLSAGDGQRVKIKRRH